MMMFGTDDRGLQTSYSAWFQSSKAELNVACVYEMNEITHAVWVERNASKRELFFNAVP